MLFPARSPGLLVARLGQGALAYDPQTETAHHLNPTSLALLSAGTGATSIEEMVALWARQTNTDPRVVARQVAANLEELVARGLAGRTSRTPALRPPAGSAGPPPGPHCGAIHTVVDHRIQFRGQDPRLLAMIDRYVGTAGISRLATVYFDVTTTDQGHVVLITNTEWRFPTRQAFLDQLPGVMNEFAARSHSCAVLHAGAVRSPIGQVVVLPAPSNAGKSTLTARLVQAGWDYLGDEAIGIRSGTLAAVGYPKRLALAAASRAVLGLPPSSAPHVAVRELRSDVGRLAGDVGPITRVVLPEYRKGAAASLELLDPPAAIKALMANTLNLARAGQEGLTTLCHLATSVPVHVLVHGGSADAAAAISRL